MIESSSEFFLTDWGEAFLQEKFLFQKNFGFDPVSGSSTDQTDVLLFKEISFWKFSFDREVKLGFLGIRSRSAVLVTSLLCLHYSTHFVFVKRFGEIFLPFLQLFFGKVFRAFKIRPNGLFRA